jgi:hypothetical protein
MAKIVTIHQPNYLPWTGLFSKMKQANCLILGDTYLLGGQSVLNRNKIRTATGWKYLTIPLGHKAEGKRICDLQMPMENSWQKDHWKNIHDNYIKAPYFKLHQSFFADLYYHDFNYVCEFTEAIIRYLIKCFSIDVEVIRARDLRVDTSLEKTDLMIALLKNAGADVYLSGPSGRTYLETEKVPANNIELKYFHFQHPVYPQRYPGFEPNLAAIDLLFSVGPQSSELVRTSGSIAASPV